MKKLISMTDYVLEQTEECRFKDDCEFAYSVRKYANFLKQPLTLSMFIPTDENGCVLEDITPHGLVDRYSEKCKQYQQAKSKVIFEGFEVKERSCNDSIFMYVENGLIAVYYFNNQSEKFEPNTDFKTIEDLIPYNLTLTDKI